jgi:hypothetical protein
MNPNAAVAESPALPALQLLCVPATQASAPFVLAGGPVQ